MEELTVCVYTCATYSILVEHVESHASELLVAPVAVDEEEALEMGELGDGEVGGHDGLHALLSADAHADVGALDHIHVVRPVPYR